MLKRKRVGLVLQLSLGERERERKMSKLFRERERDKDALFTWSGPSQHRVTTSQRWFDDVSSSGLLK